MKFNELLISTNKSQISSKGCGKEVCAVITNCEEMGEDTSIHHCGDMCYHHKEIHYCDECQEPDKRKECQEIHKNTPHIQTNGSLDCCSKEDIKRNETDFLKCTVCNNTGFLSPKNKVEDEIKKELLKDYENAKD